MTYEDIYSCFLQKIDDVSLIKESKTDAYSIMNGYLHSAYSETYIRKLFTTLKLDDIENALTYELINSVDEESDDEFVKDIISERMVISWMKPRIDNQKALSGVIIGGKEEKVLKNDLALNKERLKEIKTELKRKIRDYGYNNGTYGEL